MSIKGGQDDWSIFETDKAAPSHDRKNKVEYQTGIYAGDVLTFQATILPYENFSSPLPAATQCQAFVLMKSLRTRSIPSQADIRSLQLAIKFPVELKLQQWKPGQDQEAITQYDATIQQVMKLTKLPTPNAWATLTQLPEAQLALLSQNTATANAANWISQADQKQRTLRSQSN
jgi:hypothetical protein